MPKTTAEVELGQLVKELEEAAHELQQSLDPLYQQLAKDILVACKEWRIAGETMRTMLEMREL